MAQSSASQFSKLLRRSKFASYDPSIAQIYTSYGGHASRGHFGLKRPLPKLARTRAPALTISAVDTPEYQTDWENAEDAEKWLKRWDDTGAPVTVDGQSSWFEQARETSQKWVCDSEFDRELEHRPTSIPGASPVHNRAFIDPSSSQMIPFIEAMDPKQFERFLERLRRLRPQFQAYLEKTKVADLDAEQAQRLRELANLYQFKSDSADYKNNQEAIKSDIAYRKSIPLNMYAEGQPQAKYSLAYKRFLAEVAEKRNTRPESKTLIGNAHPFAGLNYHHPSSLQNILTNPPVPGHILGKEHYSDMSSRNRNAMRDRSAGTGKQTRAAAPYLTAIAGQIGHIPGADVEAPRGGERSSQPWSFNFHPPETDETPRDPKEGQDIFRFSMAALMSVPVVVKTGLARQGLNGVRIETEAKSWAEAEKHLTNPHRPGSAEYVAWQSKLRVKPSPRKRDPVTLLSYPTTPFGAPRTRSEGQSGKSIAELQKTLGAILGAHR